MPSAGDATVCGLPIVGSEEFGQPLAALVVVKMLEDDGVRYAVRATDGLQTIEALGMARAAVLKLEKAIVAYDLDDDDDGD